MGNFCSCIGMGAQLPFRDKTSSKALYFHVVGQQALSEVGEESRGRRYELCCRRKAELSLIADLCQMKFRGRSIRNSRPRRNIYTWVESMMSRLNMKVPRYRD